MNEREFINVFSTKITNTDVEDHCNFHGVGIYIYKPDEHKFYNTGEDQTLKEYALRKKARIRVRKFIPVYLDGKYIRPSVVDDDSAVITNVRLVVNPHTMLAIGKFILYYLNEKLQKHGEEN